MQNIMIEYEKFSYSQIEQVQGWFDVNSDIRWFSNAVGEFGDEFITEYYEKDDYGKNTRWIFWNNLVSILKKYDIQSNLDIGCANNHFSYLCNKNNIYSIGIDPRKNCIETSDKIFKDTFGNKFGYVGSIKTFVDYFTDRSSTVSFDCITILNFLHGVGHVSEEIDKLFKLLPKITNYIVITEPRWGDLNLPVMTEGFKKLEEIDNTVCEHVLYQLK